MPTINLASKYSNKVDELFKRSALKQLVTNNEYDWTGVDTVNVYSINTVDMHDYNRNGSSSDNQDPLHRYGAPEELGNSVQSMQISKDRSWTFTIDKLNKSQTQMVMDAGKACARQIALVVIPEVDTYVFRRIAVAAQTAGNASTTAAAITNGKNNAYSLLLNAQEALGNANVPEEGRVALVSYKMAGLLKQDPAFMRECDTAQNMQIKGLLGEVDGLKIVKVPASRLPSVTANNTTTYADFIIAHPIATVAPTVLSEYKIHTDAPGISGWLAEGRIAYDAFVLDNKACALWYQGPELPT